MALGWIVQGLIKLNQDRQDFHLSFAIFAFCFEFEQCQIHKTEVLCEKCLSTRKIYSAVNSQS